MLRRRRSRGLGTYVSFVRLAIGDEKIVFDRFHIMMHMNEAVDRVRQENRALLAEGDERRPVQSSCAIAHPMGAQRYGVAMRPARSLFR